MSDRIRTRVCVTCGNPFSYTIGRGKDRKHCSRACWIKAKINKRIERYASLPKCKNPDCNGKASRISYGLCEACYGRVRRKGTYQRPKPKYIYKTGNGYLKVLDPTHILADSNGNVFQHRKVAYEKYGNGLQHCFWCGTSLHWSDVVVDHLNEDKQDNHPDNLVISCNACNRARGAMLPFIARMKSDAFEVLISQSLKYRERIRAIQNKNVNTA